YFLQGVEAVDVFFHGCFFLRGGAIPVYYLTVVFKKSHVIDCCLYAQNLCELVVHFYGSLAHAVFYPAALYPYMIIVAHLTFIFSMQLLAQKSKDVFGLHTMYRLFNKLPIE